LFVLLTLSLLQFFQLDEKHYRDIRPIKNHVREIQPIRNVQHDVKGPMV
jgi:hypothetical protein